MSFSVVLVDDNHPFLEAARSLLECAEAVVLGVAHTSADALDLVARHRPDVVLVDVHLGSESGVDLVRRLSDDAVSPESTVILMSTYAEADLAALLEDVPAAGFLTKTRLSADAVHEIRRHTSG